MMVLVLEKPDSAVPASIHPVTTSRSMVIMEVVAMVSLPQIKLMMVRAKITRQIINDVFIIPFLSSLVLTGVGRRCSKSYSKV